MISLDSKTQTTASSSPLSTAPLEETEGTLSFSDLLKGIDVKKDDNTVQNGVMVLSIKEESPDVKPSEAKGTTLLSLLKGEATADDSEAALLDPKITATMTPDELKKLINDAKSYLKNQILQSEGFKKAEIDALPKTLKGLTQIAQKLGIDISKVSLEEVKVDVKSMSKADIKVEVKETKQDKVVEVKSTPLQNDDAIEVKVANKIVAKSTQLVDDDSRLMQQTRADVNVKETPKEIKSTPLFKAQVQTEITTEQLVNAKVTTIEQKTPKEKANDTLKLLLRGDKVTKSDSGFTSDFSVATARVIAPSATTESSKNLESLLRGDSSENNTSSKLDGLNVPKADSFEVKLNEAKQMTKYLSQDVKTAIEDYKAPFTRIKVQLNPQNLGDVELTVVQRGKNLHINLSSNNAAINALAINANDLKTQLSNNGINNASLNFNNNSQSSEGGAASQQQNSQNGHRARDEYSHFEMEETNEEILSSLEIVVPYYA